MLFAFSGNDRSARKRHGVTMIKQMAIAVVSALLAATSAQAQAPTWTVPTEKERCPSKWGASDERGSANHQKPAAVLNASKLIKSGEVIELAPRFRASTSP
jgi:hypothetical protein